MQRICAMQKINRYFTQQVWNAFIFHKISVRYISYRTFPIILYFTEFHMSGILY